MFVTLICLHGAVSALDNISPMSFLEERIIWQCEALGHPYSYRIELLEIGAQSFELAIYRGSNLDPAAIQQRLHIATPVRFGQEIAWDGLTATGEKISLTIFPDGSVGFRVVLAQIVTTGRCIRHVESN